jgi:hypothetical protein
MRMLTLAFLLLLGNDGNGRAHVRHHGSRPGIEAANHSALLAATPATTPVRKDVDAAQPQQLLASEGSLHDRRVQSAPAPTRDSSSLCSCERTTDQAARPPPLHS